MKTLKNHGKRPASAPLVADDILEFHAGRLVLLLLTCGKAGTINGLTKMAKLDFFVRYPEFFTSIVGRSSTDKIASRDIEAAMVRHHYGPWDKRYYHILAFLEARRLISIKKAGKSFRISLTKSGKAAAQRFASAGAFTRIYKHMLEVGNALGDRSGNELKAMIYENFDEEVGKRRLGQTIESAKK